MTGTIPASSGAKGTSRGTGAFAEWERRKLALLDAMQGVMGAVPGEEKRCRLDVVVDEEIDCGAYLRQKITYSSEPGSRTPAYLTIPKEGPPKGRSRFPAVLCLHPTDDEYGCGVVVGLSGKKNRSYAHELALQGFVTLSPAYPLLAEYQPDLHKLGYQSGTMKAIWDNIRGLDLLASLHGVDPRGFAVIGHSLGGHNGIFTAAFEPRIQVVISNCGFDSFRDYQGGDLSGWRSDRYMPRLQKDASGHFPFDFDRVISALAPRRCLLSAPLQDTNFNWHSVQKVVEAAAPAFRAHGAEDNLKALYPNCGHDFPDDVREAAYGLIRNVLTLEST